MILYVIFHKFIQVFDLHNGCFAKKLRSLCCKVEYWYSKDQRQKLEEKLGLIREFIKNKLEICFTVNVVRPVDIVPSGNILPPVDVKQPAKLPVTPKTSLVPTRNLSNKPQTSFNSKRPLQNITGTNLAPNYVEILSPRKKCWSSVTLIGKVFVIRKKLALWVFRVQILEM